MWMPENTESADAVFTYDASLMTPQGAILMNPGKMLRKGEPDLHRLFYQAMNIPVIGQVTGDATCEAGDTLWLDDHTLLIGRGYRTNQAGITQMQSMLGNQRINVLAFDYLACFASESVLYTLLTLPTNRDKEYSVITSPALNQILSLIYLQRFI